jgi:hypothetical protein
VAAVTTALPIRRCGFHTIKRDNGAINALPQFRL